MKGAAHDRARASGARTADTRPTGRTGAADRPASSRPGAAAAGRAIAGLSAGRASTTTTDRAGSDLPRARAQSVLTQTSPIHRRSARSGALTRFVG